MSKYFITIIFLFSLPNVLSQDLSQYPRKLVKPFEEARQLYINKSYLAALEKINTLIEKHGLFQEAYLLKADILHETGQFAAETACLERVLEIDSLKYPKVYYMLGIALKNSGEYAKAKRAYLRFIEIAGNQQILVGKSRKEIENCDFALKQIGQAYDFQPVGIGSTINTASDEYWPSLSIDGKTLVFTRLLPFTDSLSGRRFYQEDFFISEFTNGQWGEAEPISSVNTPENEGAQAISQDAGLLFFTACSHRDTWGGCDIYFSQKTGKEWLSPRNAGKPVNSSGWDSQPSVSANNGYLYFVSNRNGGKGGMDIWRCRLIGFEGEIPHWGRAENLGDSINTSGNEMSPFIHPDGQTLYFASDYWQGMGGNDLFYSKLKADSSWSRPVNLGYPVNSWHDEQGLVVDASGQTAYYSSDKDGNGMDIFSFKMPGKIRPVPVTYVQGRVVDAANGGPVVASVEMIDLEDAGKAVYMNSNEEGEFLTGIPLGRNYMMNISAPGYLFFSEHFRLNDIKSAVEPFLSEIRLSPVAPGSVTVLRNIFFDTGSSQLLPESRIELNKLVDFLNRNPSLHIEIGGHTDNVGGEQFNLELSARRAESVCRFLIRSGIGENRLSSHGYGFSQPLESNDTEAGRAVNRRTEFRIVELKK
ncbi:MAG: OmpA family protein [Prolixibacteraceae bacterium]|nr:OmpA family protein [Prolixibacteraceae bacterium]